MTYIAADGVTYTGEAGHVLNALDSAECAMFDNIPDMMDGSIDVETIVRECMLLAHVRYVLDHAADLAPYL